MERFARIGAGWFATCILGGLAAVAGAILIPREYLWLGLALGGVGVVAIVIGLVGIAAEMIGSRHPVAAILNLLPFEVHHPSRVDLVRRPRCQRGTRRSAFWTLRQPQ
jgi:hypothetical protein